MTAGFGERTGPGDPGGGVAADQVWPLPADVTSFLGRRRERGDIKRLLSESRLVTLTGAGGVGKTRLARRVAADLRRAFTDGVRFIDLTTFPEPDQPCAGTDDAEGLAHLLADDLRLPHRVGRTSVQLLTEHIGGAHELWVLDNCEHVSSGAGSLCSALLLACPRLRIIATSRSPLAVAGESAFAVPALATPDPQTGHDAAELMLYESVALFAARAAATDPSFRLTDENQQVVAELCHRLDGIPLALELAAAWLRALGPEDLLARLTDRFALLTEGNRAAPDRQQTLRACVDWSYSLCTEHERVLWRRLAVFVGGCDLEAIEAVCSDDQLGRHQILRVVAGLVDKSVITREGRRSAARYRMLETLRDYAGQRLLEAGESEAFLRRHLAYHQQLVADVKASWLTDSQVDSLDRIRRAQSNLRSAVEFSLGDSDQPEEALRIVTDLPWLSWWWGQGGFREGQSWLERALSRAKEPTVLRAKALVLSAELTLAQGDRDGAQRLFQEGEELARQLGDPSAIARADHTLGAFRVFAMDPEGATAALVRARDILRASPEPDLDQLFGVSLTLATSAAILGNHELVEECQAELAKITGRGQALQQASWILAQICYLNGDLAAAQDNAETFLRFSRDHGGNDAHGNAWALEVLAWIAADHEHFDVAATLLGAAESHFTDSGTSIDAFTHVREVHHDRATRSRSALGPGIFDKEQAAGVALSTGEAIAFALNEKRTAAAASEPRGVLTRRELQVADLIAQGLSNKQIAEKLVISQRTAENHVDHILTKLGFTSRTQVATWVSSQTPDL